MTFGKSLGLSESVSSCIKTGRSTRRLQIFSEIKGTKGCDRAPSHVSQPLPEAGLKAVGSRGGGCGLGNKYCP